MKRAIAPYGALFAASLSAMLIIDHVSGQILGANPAATRFYG